MRKAKLSQQEIAEMDESKKLEVRNGGLSLMQIRDRGWTKVHDHTGQPLTLHWHTERELDEGESLQRVPEGMFMIESSKYRIIFNVDELRSWLRWA